MRYIITVDDSDRADAPDKPWVALMSVMDGNEEVDGPWDGTSGMGTTPAQAISDLLYNSDREMVEAVNTP